KRSFDCVSRNALWGVGIGSPSLPRAPLVLAHPENRIVYEVSSKCCRTPGIYVASRDNIEYFIRAGVCISYRVLSTEHPKLPMADNDRGDILREDGNRIDLNSRPRCAIQNI